MLFTKAIGLVFATALIVASSASTAWAASEWKKNGKKIPPGLSFGGEVNGVANLVKLSVEGRGETVIKCTGTAMSGFLEAPNKVRSVGTVFKGCTAESATIGGPCAATTPGFGEGLIVLNPLKGELVEVANAEAAEERGLLLKPAEGMPVTIVEGVCIPGPGDLEIGGEVIAEIKNKKIERPFVNLIYLVSAGKQKIREFVGGVRENILSSEVNEVVLKTEPEFAWNVTARRCGANVAEDIEVT